MKTLVFGPGFLGHKIASFLPHAKLSWADITDPEQIAHAIETARPDVVVNAAGKTGRPNVDWCEAHALETWRSNALGPMLLHAACERRSLYLLHLASGCVFYGPSPSPGGWLETDAANPSAVYSRSKYAADLYLQDQPGVGIARLRMPIDEEPGPRNLITKLAAYTRVVDVENSVTLVPDLLRVVAGLLARRAEGIYHAVNPGTLRHAELLEGYRRWVHPEHQTEMLTEDQLVSSGLALRARSNCVLQSPRLDALGLTMRPIQDALEGVLRAYAARLRAGDTLRPAPGTGHALRHRGSLAFRPQRAARRRVGGGDLDVPGRRSHVPGACQGVLSL